MTDTGKGKHFPKRKPENFTLIELLVVIAVIAVLAGLLLPSLQKARETAKVIQCRNSIRNIGLAVLTYSQDYQGWFPAHWDGKRSKSWLDLLGQNEKDVTPYHNRKICHCPSQLHYRGLKHDPLVNSGYQTCYAWPAHNYFSMKTVIRPTDACILLEVSKGYFDDPGYDNDKTAILNLPATDAAIWRAVEAVDAASEEECAFRCTDCLLPSLRDAINDAIDEEGGIGQINEFAQLLAQKNQIWDANDLVKYKALLSVAGHPSLQDAMQLMHGLDAYELRPEVAQTWEYAEAALREKYPDLPEVLFQTPQAGQVGRELLERDHAVITDYGLLRRKDGGQLPVFQPEQQENEITGPAFAGM